MQAHAASLYTHSLPMVYCEKVLYPRLGPWIRVNTGLFLGVLLINPTCLLGVLLIQDFCGVHHLQTTHAYDFCCVCVTF